MAAEIPVRQTYNALKTAVGKKFPAWRERAHRFLARPNACSTGRPTSGTLRETHRAKWGLRQELDHARLP
ncbi:hypothetical protein [Actinocrispum sp. NPDC049592]|uniref:hypothetical protein n=1 Tax=Actinocrispum sp. NPDC049592 TaxID=3154835 RepID=UPI00342D0B5D